MTTEVVDYDVLEVSLVSRAASRKQFLLLKSEEVEGMDLEELVEIIAKVEAEGEDQLDELLKEGLSEKAVAAVRAALRLLNAYRDELPATILQTLAQLAGYGYPEPAVEKKSEEGRAEEPVSKSLDLSDLPLEVRSRVEALWKRYEEVLKRAEDLEEELRAEREAQREREFLAKAQEFSLPGIEAEALGRLLKRIDDALPDEYPVMERILRAADQVVRESALFKELGADTGGSGEDLESAIAELMAKDPGLTREMAVDRLIADRPDLYERFKSSNRR